MEGLPILFDKSALEMLSAEQLETLCRHFFLTVPPILLVEILGDLHSTRKTGQVGIQTDLVKRIANKILTNSAVKSYPYRIIRGAELHGNFVGWGGFRPTYCRAYENGFRPRR